MDYKGKSIIVKESDKPVWQTVLGAVLLGTVLVQGIIMASRFYEGDMISALNNLGIMLIALLYGVKFSIHEAVCFDIVKSKYKKQYKIVFLKFGTWKHLPQIEYISVFRQQVCDEDGNKGFMYDVNVWHTRTEHFTIYNNRIFEASY
jgi:hypothetical protein